MSDMPDEVWVLRVEGVAAGVGTYMASPDDNIGHSTKYVRGDVVERAIEVLEAVLERLRDSDAR